MILRVLLQVSDVLLPCFNHIYMSPKGMFISKIGTCGLCTKIPLVTTRSACISPLAISVV